jgi:hypothetical protein
MTQKFSIFNFQFSVKPQCFKIKFLKITNSFQISNFKFQIFLLFYTISYFPLSIIYAPEARAEMLNSNTYKIQMGNVDMSAGLPTSTNYKLGLTGGQIAPGQYGLTGNVVRAGFWYLKTIIPFRFSISGLQVDFGTLTPNTPIQNKTSVLTVSSGGAGGYQVTARENDALKTGAGSASIVDTSCDNSGCDETNAGVWTLNNSYGFGYNMSGNDIPATFSNSTYFRPFPSATALENPAIVMSSLNVGRNRIATVTYKINVGGSQAAGDYKNYIVYVATPTY